PKGEAAAKIVIRGGARVLRLEAKAVQPDVILEVPPHAWEVDDRADAESLKVSLRADAGQQEQERRVDGPCAQDHFPGHANGMDLAVVEEIEACAARAGERQLDRLRVGPDRQVLVTH